MGKKVLRDFAKYASQNVLGMMGISLYILADTLFIARALGPLGIASLNLAIAVYCVIQGLGLMVGIGGATRYTILKARAKVAQSQAVFSQSLKMGFFVGLGLAGIGFLGSDFLASLLGSDPEMLPLTSIYLKTILFFSPFYILNHVLIAFIRNDYNPRLPMIAMLAGSFSNIILDYIFLFPLDMGMFGAALATGLSPMISLAFLQFHFVLKKGGLVFGRSRLSFSSVGAILSLGLSALVTEVSSAVVLITFNLVIMDLKGSLGVAAFGIVTNIAHMGFAIFTGIAQGAQPLISRYHGLNRSQTVLQVAGYSLATILCLASLMYFGLLLFAEPIIAAFNNQGQVEVAQLAFDGFKYYFFGFFFVGPNIVAATYLSGRERAKAAFLISLTRGFLLVVPLLILLSRLWGMCGVWLAFLLTEAMVSIAAGWWIRRGGKGTRV